MRGNGVRELAHSNHHTAVLFFGTRLARTTEVFFVDLVCQTVPAAIAEPERAEPACLGARPQVIDASLLPRDRAPLAAAAITL